MSTILQLPAVPVPAVPTAFLSSMAWLILGMLLGPFAMSMVSGRWAAARRIGLKNILRGNSEPGWIIAQVRNRYKLLPLHDAADGDFYVEVEGDRHFVDNPVDKMHTLMGVPLGIWHSPDRPIADAEIAAAGAAESRKVTDGGGLADDEAAFIDSYREQLQVSEAHGDQRILRYLNPALAPLGELSPDEINVLDRFRNRQVIGSREEEVNGEDRTVVYGNPYYADGAAGVVDASDVGRVLFHDQESDTPRKAANNAKEAERSFDRFEGAKRTASLIVAFMLGALAPRIAGNGGGGGGLPIHLAAPVDVMPLVVDVATLGLI